MYTIINYLYVGERDGDHPLKSPGQKAAVLKVMGGSGGCVDIV